MSFSLQHEAGTVESLRQQLAPAFQAGYTLRLRCGKCTKQRVLDELRVVCDWTRDHYQLTSNLPASPRPGFSTVSAGSPGKVRRPSIGRESMVLSRASQPGRSYQVYRYACHPHCGATPRYTERHLLEAFLRAFADGRTEVVVGVDL
jgi:hypothetical protein